jgi:DNA-binding protein HU-beta
MKKAEFVSEVAAQSGLTQTQVKAALQAVSSLTTKQLQDGNEAILPGIGKLSTSIRAARQGRNPKTGDPVSIEASVSVKFKPASELKAAVQ